MCVKTDEVSNFQDVLIFVTKGVAILNNLANKAELVIEEADRFVYEALFMTITNANFDDKKILDRCDTVTTGLKITREASILRHFTVESAKV